MTRRLAGLAVVVALLAGCSDGEPAPAPTPTASDTRTPTERVRAAPAAARAAGGATYAYELAGKPPAGPVDSIRGGGRIDFTTDTAETRGDFGLVSGGKAFDVVTRGTTFWLAVPPRLRTGFVRTPWVSTTIRASRLGMNTLNHPGTAIDVLAAATDVTEIGRTDLDDIRTTHYRARVAAAAFVAGLPPELRQQTDQALKAGRVSALAIEVWLDDEGRPRRIRSRPVQPADPKNVEIQSGLDITTYGAVEPIQVPAPVETTALPRIESLLAAVGIGAPR